MKPPGHLRCGVLPHVVYLADGAPAPDSTKDYAHGRSTVYPSGLPGSALLIA